jgi:Leucine-rich repeat (LRR) protein
MPKPTELGAFAHHILNNPTALAPALPDYFRGPTGQQKLLKIEKEVLKDLCAGDEPKYKSAKAELKQLLRGGLQQPEQPTRPQSAQAAPPLPQDVAATDNFLMKVGGQVFPLTAEQIDRAGGLLAAIFLGEFPVQTDAAGVYKHRFPLITSPQMERIVDFLNGSLPPHLPEEEIHCLRVLNETWFVAGFTEALEGRSYNLHGHLTALNPPETLTSWARQEARNGKNAAFGVARQIEEIIRRNDPDDSFLELSAWELTTLPKEIGNIKGLRSLRLSLHRLTEIPRELGKLNELETLDIDWCPLLPSLPDGLCELTNLVNFSIEYCTELTSLPENFGKLKSLEKLCIKSCDFLTELPRSMSDLTCLKVLEIDWCKKLNNLSESIMGLNKLTNLDIVGCPDLHNLPCVLGNMAELKEFSITYCSLPQVIPDSPGRLTELRKLRIRGCEGLKTLPASLGDLLQLQTLSLAECSQLTHLPGMLNRLTSLRELSLEECSNITELPNTVSGLVALNTLSLDSCSQLTSLPSDIGHLSALLSLRIVNCRSLSVLPFSIALLAPHLRFMDLRNSPIHSRPPELTAETLLIEGDPGIPAELPHPRRSFFRL